MTLPILIGLQLFLDEAGMCSVPPAQIAGNYRRRDSRYLVVALELFFRRWKTSETPSSDLPQVDYLQRLF